jgi:transcriptional regulator with XRE-family HTH domain
MDFDHNPRKRLREFRSKMKWSVAKLASELKCSRQMVYALEADYGGTGKVPGLDLARRIAEKTRIPARAWDALANVKHHRPRNGRAA